jgi:D-arabinose 1-dehydrogenase-like Zn-dependent alcohol dehydrogenase
MAWMISNNMFTCICFIKLNFVIVCFECKLCKERDIAIAISAYTATYTLDYYYATTVTICTSTIHLMTRKWTDDQTASCVCYPYNG